MLNSWHEQGSKIVILQSREDPHKDSVTLQVGGVAHRIAIVLYKDADPDPESPTADWGGMTGTAEGLPTKEADTGSGGGGLRTPARRSRKDTTPPSTDPRLRAMLANQATLEAQVGALTDMLRRALPFTEAGGTHVPPPPKRKAEDVPDPSEEVTMES